MATETIKELLIKVSLSTKDLQKQMKGLKGTLNNFSRTVKAVGGALATGFIGKELLTKTAHFEKELAKLSTISGITGDELKTLGQDAQKMGVKFGVASDEVVEGLTEMSRLGFEMEESLELIPSLLKFTSANTADFKHTVGLAEATINDFNLTAKEIPGILDVFTVALSKGQLNMESLRQTFKRSSPIAYGLGIRIQEVASATALLARAGFKGEQSGRALNKIMSELTSPSTKKSAQALQKIGMSLKDQFGNLKPFTQRISEITEKVKGLTAEERANFALAVAGRDHYDKFLALIDNAPGVFQKLVNEMDLATGKTDEFFEIIKQTLGFKWDQILSGVDSLIQKLGVELAPLFGVLADKALEFINTMLDADWTVIGNDIKSELKSIEVAFGVTKDTIVSILDDMKDIIQEGLKATAKALGIETKGMLDNWSQMWVAIASGAQIGMKAVKGIIVSAVQAIGSVLKAFHLFTKFQFSAGWAELKNGARDLTNTWKSVASDINAIRTKGYQRIDELRKAQKDSRDAFYNKTLYGPTGAFSSPSVSNFNVNLNGNSPSIPDKRVIRAVRNYEQGRGGKYF